VVSAFGLVLVAMQTDFANFIVGGECPCCVQTYSPTNLLIAFLANGASRVPTQCSMDEDKILTIKKVVSGHGAAIRHRIIVPVGRPY